MGAEALGVIGAVGSVLGVAGLIGGTAAFLRAGYAKRTTELWKEEAEALEQRLSTVEASEHEWRAKYAELETKYDALSDQVTGKTAIDELGRQQAEGFEMVLEAMNANARELARLVDNVVDRRVPPVAAKRSTTAKRAARPR